MSTKNPKDESEKPPFTYKQLHAVIPSHCFERCYLKSFSYLFTDILMAVALFYAALLIEHQEWNILWPAYWAAQGVICTGIWVIAHECGHGAFSPSEKVNDVVGFILHSVLLVPYFSWKITHSNHHQKCSHMEKDQVFVPKTRSQMGLEKGQEMEDPSPLVTLLYVMRMLLLGWPGYLLFNLSGQSYSGWVSHFFPDAPIFTPQQYAQVVYSNAGVLAMMSGLAYCSVEYGIGQVFKFYIVPYLLVNMFLVLITFLQHTHLDIPHYRGEDWSFLKGALCTVDRDYGTLLNMCFHHIGDTHVAHHLFSKMPHYHCQEATQALKKTLGSFYKKDDTNIMTSVFQTMRDCKFVEDQGTTVYYQTK